LLYMIDQFIIEFHLLYIYIQTIIDTGTVMI